LIDTNREKSSFAQVATRAKGVAVRIPRCEKFVNRREKCLGIRLRENTVSRKDPDPGIGGELVKFG
jgi:hypothetical protein